MGKLFENPMQMGKQEVATQLNLKILDPFFPYINFNKQQKNFLCKNSSLRQITIKLSKIRKEDQGIIVFTEIH